MFRLLAAIISLITLLPLILLVCFGAVVYFNYIQVQPAEYSFIQEASEIKSIEFARFVFSENGLIPTKAGIIAEENYENFMTDLKGIECHTGITGSGFKALFNGDAIEGVIINYNDGGFEFLTPYLCVHSGFNPQSITDLLGVRVYGFDAASFGALLDEYGVGVTWDDVDNLDGIFDQLPDVIPQN